MDDRKIVVLRRYPSLIHAELAKSALALTKSTRQSKGPYPREAATFDVLLRSEDVEAALAILGPDETFTDRSTTGLRRSSARQRLYARRKAPLNPSPTSIGNARKVTRLQCVHDR